MHLGQYTHKVSFHVLHQLLSSCEGVWEMDIHVKDSKDG